MPYLDYNPSPYVPIEVVSLDFDNDGIISDDDRNSLIAALGSRVGIDAAYNLKYDLNYDGVIDAEDLAIFDNRLSCNNLHDLRMAVRNQQYETLIWPDDGFTCTLVAINESEIGRYLGLGERAGYIDLACHPYVLKRERLRNFTLSDWTGATLDYWTTDVSTTDSAVGDVNKDGVIDSADMQLVAQHILGVYTLTGDAYTAADVNFDGVVDSADLQLMAQYIVGTIDGFNTGAVVMEPAGGGIITDGSWGNGVKLTTQAVAGSYASFSQYFPLWPRYRGKYLYTTAAILQIGNAAGKLTLTVDFGVSSVSKTSEIRDSWFALEPSGGYIKIPDDATQILITCTLNGDAAEVYTAYIGTMENVYCNYEYDCDILSPDVTVAAYKGLGYGHILTGWRTRHCFNVFWVGGDWRKLSNWRVWNSGTILPAVGYNITGINFPVSSSDGKTRIITKGLGFDYYSSTLHYGSGTSEHIEIYFEEPIPLTFNTTLTDPTTGYSHYGTTTPKARLRRFGSCLRRLINLTIGYFVKGEGQDV